VLCKWPHLVLCKLDARKRLLWSSTTFSPSAPPRNIGPGLQFCNSVFSFYSFEPPAVSNASWITITSGNLGACSGTVSYSVPANPAAARIGTMTVAGKVFTVSSAGATAELQMRPARGSIYPTLLPIGYHSCALPAASSFLLVEMEQIVYDLDRPLCFFVADDTAYPNLRSCYHLYVDAGSAER
jgi:hypothetical protein